MRHYSSLFRRKGSSQEEVRLAAMDNFINPTLRTPFMTSDLLSVNLVSAEGAKETVKAVKDLPDRVLEKVFKDPNLPLKVVKRKQTRPNLIKVPQKQTTGNSTGYQQPPSNKRKELILSPVVHRPSIERVSKATNIFRKRKKQEW